MEGVLCDLLCRLRTAKHAIENAEHHPPVPVVQHAERIRVALHDAFEDSYVIVRHVGARVVRDHHRSSRGRNVGRQKATERACSVMPTPNRRTMTALSSGMT